MKVSTHVISNFDLRLFILITTVSEAQITLGEVIFIFNYHAHYRKKTIESSIKK